MIFQGLYECIRLDIGHDVGAPALPAPLPASSMDFSVWVDRFKLESAFEEHSRLSRVVNVRPGRCIPPDLRRRRNIWAG